MQERKADQKKDKGDGKDDKGNNSGPDNYVSDLTLDEEVHMAKGKLSIFIHPFIQNFDTLSYIYVLFNEKELQLLDNSP